jgi:hypothetical protein
MWFGNARFADYHTLENVRQYLLAELLDRVLPRTWKGLSNDGWSQTYRGYANRASMKVK